MLPIATPPNAVAFSYGHLKVIDMVSSHDRLRLRRFSVFFSCNMHSNDNENYLKGESRTRPQHLVYCRGCHGNAHLDDGFI